MPAWQTIEEWGGLKIHAEPVGWRKNCFFRWCPYVYGTKPQFTIAFERLNTPSQHVDFEWFLRFPWWLETGHPVKVPQLQPGQVHREPAGDRLLGLTGDTILGLRQQGRQAFHTLYSFKVVAYEELALGGLIATLAALLAAILAKSF